MPNKPEYHKKWTSKINNWETISIDEYKFIFDQAKERFEDVISENESITNKAISIATAVVAFTGFYIGIAIQNHFFVQHRGFIYTCIVASIINLLLVGALIFPRNAMNRGLSPEISTNDDFDNDEDLGYYHQKLYYNAIGVLQDNIDVTINANNQRITLYKVVLFAFATLIGLVSAGIALII